MCNLEHRRGSSEASRSSWPSKHTCNNNILMDLSQEARNSRTASSCSRRPLVARSSSSSARRSSARTEIVRTAIRRVYAILRRTAARTTPCALVDFWFYCLHISFFFSFPSFLRSSNFFRSLRSPIPFPRIFVSCKRSGASFVCDSTWVKLYLDTPPRLGPRKSKSHVPSSAISRNKLNTARHTSEIVSQDG